MKQLVRVLIISLIPIMANAGGWGFDPGLVNAQNEYQIAEQYFKQDNIHRGCYHLWIAGRHASYAVTDHGQAEAKINILKQKYQCKYPGDNNESKR